ncbi:hypothetical protein ACVCAH_11530 [Micromonospora sp. LZ34]
MENTDLLALGDHIGGIVAAGVSDSDRERIEADLRARALAAVQGVDPAKAASEHALRVHASAAVRNATGLGLMEIVPVVNWAIEQVKNTRLDRFRVRGTYGGWVYRFPNGHEASVINDPSRPFRFEVLSDDPADAARGRVAPGLTSEQVEAKLHAIAALPAR